MRVSPLLLMAFVPCAVMAATMTIEGNYRVIKSDGLPNHATGNFPNANNPNAIKAQSYTFKVTVNPKKNASPTPLRNYSFGVALNGIPFDPGTAEYWNNDRSSGWNYEAKSNAINLGLDFNHAHVQPNGAYHYHGNPVRVHSSAPTLVGFAADGFPIYSDTGYTNDSGDYLGALTSSYRLKKGSRPSGPGGSYDGRFVQDYEYVEGAGDLDRCNGRVSKTTEYPNGTYHYVLTSNFPFIPRCFMGTPDPSFQKQGGGERRPQPQGTNQPPSSNQNLDLFYGAPNQATPPQKTKPNERAPSREAPPREAQPSGEPQTNEMGRQVPRELEPSPEGRRPPPPRRPPHHHHRRPPPR